MRVLVVVDERVAYAEDDFERFCRDAHSHLVAALAHHCGDRFLAEELAQEALIRAGDRWAKVRRLDSPVGWAFRVGANMAASSFRRRGAERRAVERVRARPVDDHHDADAGDAVAVRRALAELTDRQRQVVVLRYFLDLSADRAGEVLGMSAGAVRMQSHRALAALHARLAEDADVTEEVPDGR